MTRARRGVQDPSGARRLVVAGEPTGVACPKVIVRSGRLTGLTRLDDTLTPFFSVVASAWLVVSCGGREYAARGESFGDRFVKGREPALGVQSHLRCLKTRKRVAAMMIMMATEAMKPVSSPNPG